MVPPAGWPAAGSELKEAGIATHVVRSARMPELEASLLQLAARRGTTAAGDLSVLNSALRAFEAEPGSGAASASASTSSSSSSSDGGSAGLLDWKLPLVNAHFGRSSLAEVYASLEAATAAGAAADRATAFLSEALAALRRWG